MSRQVQGLRMTPRDKPSIYDTSRDFFAIYDNSSTTAIYDNSRQARVFMTTRDKLAYLWHLETSSRVDDKFLETSSKIYDTETCVFMTPETNSRIYDNSRQTQRLMTIETRSKIMTPRDKLEDLYRDKLEDLWHIEKLEASWTSRSSRIYDNFETNFCTK
jgi:hypothetical protein